MSNEEKFPATNTLWENIKAKRHIKVLMIANRENSKDLPLSIIGEDLATSQIMSINYDMWIDNYHETISPTHKNYCEQLIDGLTEDNPNKTIPPNTYALIKKQAKELDLDVSLELYGHTVPIFYRDFYLCTFNCVDSTFVVSGNKSTTLRDCLASVLQTSYGQTIKSNVPKLNTRYTLSKIYPDGIPNMENEK